MRGFPGSPNACNAVDPGSILFGKIPGEGEGYLPVFWPGDFHSMGSQRIGHD